MLKLNKKINELDWVDEVFIAPPMGDEGLSLGCTLKVHHKNIVPDFKPFKLDNVFLGTSYKDSDFKYDLNKYKKSPLDNGPTSTRFKIWKDCRLVSR